MMTTIKHFRWWRTRFAREILMVLAIKAVLLMVLKLAFFSDPLSARLSVEDVSRALLGAQQVEPRSRPSR